MQLLTRDDGMSILKKLLITFTLILSVSMFAGCSQQATQKWEYKTVYFDRDTSGQMDSQLKALGDDGWEYGGTLTNDGMNARYIVFKRPAK